jgi:hypothetical protein
MAKKLGFAVLAAAVVLALTSVSYADRDKSLFCICAPFGPGICSAGPLLGPGTNFEFHLTDLMVANNGGNPAVIILRDGSAPGSPTKAQVDVSNEGHTTEHQTFQTPLEFNNSVVVICGPGADGNAAVTISGYASSKRK